ncbi:MAG: DUF177 domain-containing protein [Myxococcales bacterium]|nr:DUF177 domain-containing protein [Myxococcales bacterium]
MRIPVEGIPDAGRQVAFSLREAWATEAATLSLDHPPTTLEGLLSIELASKRAGLVRVQAQVRAEAASECDRCGEDCTLLVDETSTLLYAPEESGGDAFDGGELELSADDLDLGWYAAGEISLSDVLREAIALALPARVVCADTLQCDTRTDAMLAAHAATPGHPAFQALRALSTGADDVD